MKGLVDLSNPAALTSDQAASLSHHLAVLHVFEDRRRHLHTTRSPQFLGLRNQRGLWSESDYGSDVIVGVFDTGVWPKRQSFSDLNLDPMPKRWRSVCETGDQFAASNCNKKLIGARFFIKGHEAAANAGGPMTAINGSMEFQSARDAVGRRSVKKEVGDFEWLVNELKILVVQSEKLFAFREGEKVCCGWRRREAAGAICCDRSSMRSDVCTMKGDVRTHSPSSSIFVYASQDQAGKNEEDLQHEKIKPYTRKWETIIMDTIVELDLIAKKRTLIMNHHNCDVQHDVPAVFFSTGGYTGNVYHEFNDGIMPLYITSQHFNKKVVFVILEFHNWWVMKYSDILSHLSDYPVIDFHTDERVHCFPEAIVGLKIHDELTVDSSLMEGNKSIVDFRELLDRAYQPQIRSLMHMHEHAKVSDVLSKSKRPSRIRRNVQERAFNNEPKLVIISRNGSRAITNENLLVKMAEKIGFHVQVLRPDSRTMLAEIYWALNSSDVMIGVHGAALTHFLFMKPGSVFIQVIPLGIEWAAEAYYGEPAKKLGLNYIGYQILTKESSLCDKYNKDDPVLKDPRSVTRKGWQYTKMIYLEGQTVRLDLPRFRKQLVGAYNYTIDRLKQQRSNIQSH